MHAYMKWLKNQGLLLSCYIINELMRGYLSFWEFNTCFTVDRKKTWKLTISELLYEGMFWWKGKKREKKNKSRTNLFFFWKDENNYNNHTPCRKRFGWALINLFCVVLYNIWKGFNVLHVWRLQLCTNILLHFGSCNYSVCFQ